jgi:hypothetical protein
LVLVVAIPVVVVNTVHGHLVGLANDIGHYLLAAPNDALHGSTLGQLHETADNILEERRWTTHGAKKSPAGGPGLFYFNVA